MERVHPVEAIAILAVAPALIPSVVPTVVPPVVRIVEPVDHVVVHAVLPAVHPVVPHAVRLTLLRVQNAASPKKQTLYGSHQPKLPIKVHYISR